MIPLDITLEHCRVCDECTKIKDALDKVEPLELEVHCPWVRFTVEALQDAS